MIRPIIKDEFFLSQPSAAATVADVPIAYDLLETLQAHSDECVGLAGNMIGKRVRIIAIDNNGKPLAMINPEIITAAGPYEAEEGCLSLAGKRKTTRYKTIKVRWQDTQMKTHSQTFKGFTAQIIQHEVDHCNGVII